jgi:HD-GYP domain-containing protein (c-di-GMP phosphodiesterase class II)
MWRSAGAAHPERVRAAEVAGAFSLATDLGMALPFEHGLQTTLFAARLCGRLGVDAETTRQTFYACLLFHSSCTTDAALGAEIFGGSMTRNHLPVMWGSQMDNLRGVLRSLPPPGSSPPRAAFEIARRAPRAARGVRSHVIAACEVGQMLARRVGLPEQVSSLFAYVVERWDGHGPLRRASHADIPLPVRIVHVAQDAALQRMLGPDAAAGVLREHAGRGLDPAVAEAFADDAADILALPPGTSAWEETLGCEPEPWLTLEGEAIDRALGAIGDFADLASPYLTGHSAGVAALAASAARRCGFDEPAVVALRRAAVLHDIGRVATRVDVWHRPGPLSPDEWEQVRLHAYHSERVLLRSPALAGLAAVAGAHHERLDGSGYHRATAAAGQPPPARLLATADAYHAMTEPRPHRKAMPAAQAAASLGEQCRAGHFDADLVAAVLEASGQPVERIERPAGLTEREVEVLRLLARGLQTKQIAATLGISPKTADRHIQNTYGKIGVSTRAAATLFAMEHGLMAWGEFPIPRTGPRP